MSAEITPRAPLPRMPLPVWVNRPFAYSEAAPESLEDLTYYPSSDGQPMSDNTTQFDWISMLQGELDSLFGDDPNVFVAGDLLWYPLRGDNRTRIAPDAMVILGRPRGHRDSYLQWLEDNVPPQVVFEVLSPGNSQKEMLQKLEFYERYGVQEYYEYDPARNLLEGWVRQNGSMQPVPEMNAWVSPRLGIRFVQLADTLEIYRPDGRKFQTFREANRRAETEKRRAEAEKHRADRMAAKLRELGLDPENLD